MPSLWKREKSPSWVCCYTNAEGRRLKKSTKVAVRPFKGERNKDGSQKTASDKRSEAWEFCLAIERAERSARNGTLTEQTAQKIIGEIVERSTGEPFHSASASEWLEEWAQAKPSRDRAPPQNATTRLSAAFSNRWAIGKCLPLLTSAPKTFGLTVTRNLQRARVRRRRISAGKS